MGQWEEGIYKSLHRKVWGGKRFDIVEPSELKQYKRAQDAYRVSKTMLGARVIRTHLIYDTALIVLPAPDGNEYVIGAGKEYCLKSEWDSWVGAQ